MTGAGTGFTQSHPGINEQFNNKLNAATMKYLKNLETTLGVNYAFISSYVDAFQTRIDAIEKVNATHSVPVDSLPSITLDQVAAEFQRIMDYLDGGGLGYDW